MNDEQLAALTEEERGNVYGLAYLLEALADARLEVARLTEERDSEQAQVDTLLEAVESSLFNLEQCPSNDHCNDVTRVHDRLQMIHDNLPEAVLKRQEDCDQQREDIRRLVGHLNLVKRWIDAGGYDHWCSAEGLTVDIRKAECDALCAPARTLLAKLKERYE